MGLFNPLSEFTHNLALLFCEQGRYEEAEPLYQRVLRIREEVLGPRHPHVATSLNGLAALSNYELRFDQIPPPVTEELRLSPARIVKTRHAT